MQASAFTVMFNIRRSPDEVSTCCKHVVFLMTFVRNSSLCLYFELLIRSGSKCIIHQSETGKKQVELSFVFLHLTALCTICGSSLEP